MKKIIFISLASVLICACSKEKIEINKGGDGIVRIEANHPSNVSRANVTGFEDGDKISLWAVEYHGTEAAPLQIGGNWINNEVFTKNGGLWESTRTIYWSDNPCDFYAVYPAMEIGSVDKEYFELPCDQNAPATAETLSGYEASDILWAKAENVSYSNSPVTLNFKHMMTKVVVNIIKGANFEGNLENLSPNVRIYNTVTSAYLNIANGSLEKNPYGERQTITMKKDSNDRFEAIIIPQNIERKTPLIEIAMNGISYLLEYTMFFRPGYLYNLDIILTTSPDQENIEIAIDPSLGTWE